MGEMAELATVIEVVTVKKSGGGRHRGDQQNRDHRQQSGYADHEFGESSKHENALGTPA